MELGDILIGKWLLSIEGIFIDLWQNHHDPFHAAYGIGGLIVLLVIYNCLIEKYK